jgi:hypothetical protein
MPLRRQGAKKEPGFRFYMLHDKVWRADILLHAYNLARANKGAPGVDGTTFEQIEAAGLGNRLTRLGEELHRSMPTGWRSQTRGTYRCQPPAFAGAGGAAGDDPKARRRRAATRNSDYSGPGGADRGETGAGADFRSGHGPGGAWLPAGTQRG